MCGQPLYFIQVAMHDVARTGGGFEKEERPNGTTRKLEHKNPTKRNGESTDLEKTPISEPPTRVSCESGITSNEDQKMMMAWDAVARYERANMALPATDPKTVKTSLISKPRCKEKPSFRSRPVRSTFSLNH